MEHDEAIARALQEQYDAEDAVPVEDYWEQSAKRLQAQQDAAQEEWERELRDGNEDNEDAYARLAAENAANNKLLENFIQNMRARGRARAASNRTETSGARSRGSGSSQDTILRLHEKPRLTVADFCKATAAEVVEDIKDVQETKSSPKSSLVARQETPWRDLTIDIPFSTSLERIETDRILSEPLIDDLNRCIECLELLDDDDCKTMLEKLKTFYGAIIHNIAFMHDKLVV
ncbi:hypothetical protein ACN47E_004800 [Coniothyrium glycines]